MLLVAVVCSIHFIISTVADSKSPWDANGRLICENVREVIKAGRAAGHDPKHLHLEPYLHNCFKQAPYNILQLPLFTGSRPRSRNAPLMEMEFDFNLKSIDKFETTGSIKLKAIIQLLWYDEFRRWNKSEIPIEEIIIPAREIWFPTFELLNCEGEDEERCILSPKEERRVQIFPDGRIRLLMIPSIEANCDMNLKQFPSDVEQCTLIYQLLEYLPSEVQMKESSVVEHFQDFQNEEWDFLRSEDNPAIFKTTRFRRVQNNQSLQAETEEAVSEAAVGFNVTVHLRRHNLFYIFNLIIPVLLMTILGVFAVFLEAGSGDKLNMVVTALLGFLFFQTVVSEALPKSDATPYLNYYLFYALILCAMNLGGCAIVNYVHSLQESSSAATLWIERRILRPVFGINKKINKLRHHDTEANKEEEHNWHRLASILNLLVSTIYVALQVLTLMVNLLPCLLY